MGVKHTINNVSTADVVVYGTKKKGVKIVEEKEVVERFETLRFEYAAITDNFNGKYKEPVVVGHGVYRIARGVKTGKEVRTLSYTRESKETAERKCKLMNAYIESKSKTKIECPVAANTNLKPMLLVRKKK